MAIVAVLVQLALAFVNYLTSRGRLDAAASSSMITQLQGVLDAIEKAQAARQTVRDATTVNPDSVREPVPSDDRPYRDGDVG